MGWFLISFKFTLSFLYYRHFIAKSFIIFVYWVTLSCQKISEHLACPINMIMMIKWWVFNESLCVPQKRDNFPKQKKTSFTQYRSSHFPTFPRRFNSAHFLFSNFHRFFRLPDYLWCLLNSTVRGLIRRIIGQIDAVACACESNCSDWRNFSMAYRGFPEEIRSIWFVGKMACEEFRGRLGGIVDWVWVWNSVNFTWRRWNAWNRINLQRTFQVRTSTFKFQIMFTKLSEVCMAASI